MKEMNKMKKIYFCLALVLLIITVFIILKTYGLFETKTELNVQSEVGKWVILVNNTDITQQENTKFSVDKIIWDQNDEVKEGKIAPGASGYFDIVIDPTDTDVSVRYDIGFDFSEFENTNITITSIQEINDKKIVKSGDNKYTGIITLDEISAGTTNTIRVNIAWENNEENNEHDSNLSSVPNTILNIPVTINVSQYLGETIE